MYFRLVAFFTLFTNLAYCQSSWFKHLPGWQARTSVVKGDTILTCGMNNLVMPFGDKFGTFINWNTLNGKEVGHLNIYLDSIEKDSTRSTTISYFNNSTVLEGDKSLNFINLSYGQKNERAFVLKLNSFYTTNFKLFEYTIDTFSTFINDILILPNIKIVFIPYLKTDTRFESTRNILIYKENSNGLKVKINEILNYSNLKYETHCHIINKKSNNSFFFALTKSYDYAGAPQQWEEYVIKMDTLGNELWRCQPNNNDSVSPTGVKFVQKANGNLLVSWNDYWFRPYKNQVGSRLAQGNDHCSLWFAEIDTTGKIIWRKQIKEFISKKIHRDSDHNLIHTKAITDGDGVVWSGSYSWIYKHNYLLKTDFDGNPKWYREHELYPKNDARNEFTPYDLCSTGDGGYLLTGVYVSREGNLFPTGCQKATLVKVDSFGCPRIWVSFKR